jgi:hypothetical protein
MDAVSDNRHVPLCIDLDGTLIATDTLWEGLVSVLISRPWLLFAVIFWAISGKAVLKREIAARYARKGDEWPYRAEVLERIKLARESGQPVWLVTGAAESTARTIADHLGLFDRVLHSSDTENLTSRRKRERLVSTVWRRQASTMPATAATIWRCLTRHAAPSSWLPTGQPADGATAMNRAELLPLEKISPLAILKSIRVHQWLKNILIAVPLVLNHEFADFDLLLAAIAAFFSFSFLASAVYIVNDISDLANDRQHPRKRLRPLASRCGLDSGDQRHCRRACCLPRSACKPSAADVLGRAGALRPGDHGLHVRAQAQASGRRVHPCRALHRAHHCRCGRNRGRPVLLAARLLDLLLSSAWRWSSATSSWPSWPKIQTPPSRAAAMSAATRT